MNAFGIFLTQLDNFLAFCFVAEWTFRGVRFYYRKRMANKSAT